MNEQLVGLENLQNTGAVALGILLLISFVCLAIYEKFWKEVK